MNERASILDRVRASAGHATSHPGRFAAVTRAADWETFASAATEAGSEPLGPVSRANLAGLVEQQVRRWGDGRCVAQPAAAAWLGSGSWEVASPTAGAHSFADVAIGIARASLCVAENGAVAVPPRLAPQRSLLFLCERLIVLAPAWLIVSDMHSAVSSTADDAAKGPCFQWIAGPSKTADIEQHLVVGAHGPRALVLIGVDEPGESHR